MTFLAANFQPMHEQLRSGQELAVGFEGGHGFLMSDHIKSAPTATPKTKTKAINKSLIASLAAFRLWPFVSGSCAIDRR